jgi:hypothetical protein
MTIHNWTRRPQKTTILDFYMEASSPVADVRGLVAFAKSYIIGCGGINQEGYIKCNIVGVQPGFQLQCIFDTRLAIGTRKFSRKKIRQEFILRVMDEAQRLGLSVIPLTTSNQPVVTHQMAVAATPKPQHSASGSASTSTKKLTPI